MLMICIYMRKAERFVSMQGRLQPRFYSKARSLNRQLQNGLLPLIGSTHSKTSPVG